MKILKQIKRYLDRPRIVTQFELIAYKLAVLATMVHAIIIVVILPLAQYSELGKCKDFTKKIIKLNNETARENGTLRKRLNEICAKCAPLNTKDTHHTIQNQKKLNK